MHWRSEPTDRRSTLVNDRECTKSRVSAGERFRATSLESQRHHREPKGLGLFDDRRSAIMTHGS